MVKDTCGNPCNCFGYDVDQGAKTFCVAELFISFFHIRTIVILGLFIKCSTANFQTSLAAVLSVLFDIIFLITITIQAVCGLILYFVAWRKRNVTICWIWFVVAVCNIFYPTFELLVHNSNPTSIFYYCPYNNVGCSYYLLYNAFGAFVIFKFIKWATAKGIATEIRINIKDAPDDVESQNRDHHSKKEPEHQDVLEHDAASKASASRTSKVSPIRDHTAHIKPSTAKPRAAPSKARKTTQGVNKAEVY